MDDKLCRKCQIASLGLTPEQIARRLDSLCSECSEIVQPGGRCPKGKEGALTPCE